MFNVTKKFPSVSLEVDNLAKFAGSITEGKASE